MTVRNHAIDRMARWMATGLTTAGLTVAVIPLAHGGLFPIRQGKRAGEQSLVAPALGSQAAPSMPKSNAVITAVGLRRQGPRQAVMLAPAQQASPAPVYLPQPMYYPNGAPAVQVPQQYQSLQEQSAGQDTAVARELRRLYDESGRTTPTQPGTRAQAQPAQGPQYAPPPGYALPPGYVAVPQYAAPPAGYAPQPIYYPPTGYAPAPGYAPGAVPAQVPPSQPISTDPAEDPEFFPGDSALAGQQLDGLEFEGSRPISQPAGYGFAYPGPAIQQQPTPIITAGVIPPNVEPPPAPVELPKAEELIVGTPVETDYEMMAEPRMPKKGFLGRFGATSVATRKPPVEPNPYVPNPNAQLLDDDTLPLAPGADVPGPEQDPAMAEIAKFSSSEEPAAKPVVEELPPPGVTPGIRTLPAAATATVKLPTRSRNYASELFKDESPAAKPEARQAKIASQAEQTAQKSIAPKSAGIAAGGLVPGKNIVPEQPEPALREPVATVLPDAASADTLTVRELADSAAPLPKGEPSSPYTGLALDGKTAEAAAPLMAREHRGMFFPPTVIEPAAEVPAPADPLPLPMPAELSPQAVAATAVQPVSEAPTAPARFPERSAYTQSKYEQIASRTGATGLKGFCPVRLRDHRDLADGLDEFRVQHNGRVYALSSAAALQNFLADPEKYTPAAFGYDVIVHSQTGDTVEGALDHSAWFKGRLYLFTSAENKETFVANPAGYAAK